MIDLDVEKHHRAPLVAFVSHKSLFGRIMNEYITVLEAVPGSGCFSVCADEEAWTGRGLEGRKRRRFGIITSVLT